MKRDFCLKTMCYQTGGIYHGHNYSQITLEERRKIERWRHARVSFDEIAQALKRHRSTIMGSVPARG